MSKIIQATVTCPKCGHTMETSFFRTIWGEYPENREMVMTDKINCTTCPKCNTTTKWLVSLMYTNAPQRFAVWWEPVYDAAIDSEKAQYKALASMGAAHLFNAPRIKDWQAFKDKIVELERTPRPEIPDSEKQKMRQFVEPFFKKMVNDLEKKQKKKSGCLGFVALFAISLASIWLFL